MFMWNIRSNQEVIQRIRKAFLKSSKSISFVHLIRIREVTSMDLNGIIGTTIWNIGNTKKPLVGTMRLYDISTTSYRLISLTKRLLEQRGRNNNLVYLRGKGKYAIP